MSYMPIRTSLAEGSSSGASKDISSTESVDGLYFISARGNMGVDARLMVWMETIALSINSEALAATAT